MTTPPRALLVSLAAVLAVSGGATPALAQRVLK